MTRALLLTLSLLVAAAPLAQPLRLSASVGTTSLGLVGGASPGLGVSLEGPDALGRVLVAVRADWTVVDRTALAEPYAYDDATATCSDSGNRVAEYLCNPFGEQTDVLGGYSAEVGYAPPLPVTLALGAGLRFGEVIDYQEGKTTQTQPYFQATALVPVTGRLSLEARGRLGADLSSAHVGLAVSL